MLGLHINDEYIKAEYPNISDRLQLIDLHCELTVLAEYETWASKTRLQARKTGDQERIAFYGALLKNVLHDSQDVGMEWYLFHNIRRPLEVEDEAEDDVDEESDLESTTSFMTANDDLSIHSNEDLINLLDLDEASPQPDETDNITTLLEATGITELSEVDRLLS